MFMTILVDCISQFLQELWKTSLPPGVATEESNVQACQEHSLCVVRQPNQQEYSPLISMTITGNVHDTSLEMHSQVATGKGSLSIQGSFPRSIILALPFSSALQLPCDRTAKFNFACPSENSQSPLSAKHIHEEQHQSIEPVHNESF